MKAVDKHAFRHACGRFATGVAIAAVRDREGAAHGLTVSSFTSVSLEPPLVLVCIDHKASVIRHFRSADYFGISILRQEQRAISERFARKGEDRFEGVAWHPGACGAPLVDAALAAVECAIENRVSAGDHDVFIARVVGTDVREGHPLLYFAGNYRALAL